MQSCFGLNSMSEFDSKIPKNFACPKLFSLKHGKTIGFRPDLTVFSLLVNLVSYAIVFPLILESTSGKTTINGLNFFSIPLTVKDVTIIITIAVLLDKLCRLYEMFWQFKKLEFITFKIEDLIESKNIYVNNVETNTIQV